MNCRLRRGLLAAALLIASPVVGAQSARPSAAAAPLSAESFRNPGRGAGVHAWWHWLDGAITREGITRDLEGFKAQGVVQATILNVGLFGGRDFGVPRVPFASPEWFSMYRWALAEASRLGITIGVHNCDGWSSSGGPWITPGQSMKQLVWTKTLLGGGAVDLTLPRPVAIEGLYRDVAVVAYRTTQQPSAYRSAGPRLQRNGVEEDPGTLIDGCPISGLRIQRGDRLVLSARAPLAFDRVAVHLRRPFMWGDAGAFTTRLALETSSDGRAYAAVRELALTGLNETQVVEVPRSSAPFVRLTVREMSRVDAWIPVELGELELLNAGESPAYAPSIPFVGEKTSAVKATSDDAVYEAGPDARPAVAASDVVVLTDRMDGEGRLRWQAPAGSWAVLRFGYTSTGARNGPATREGTGLEADKMDPAAVEHHFRSFPERLIAEAGELAGRTLRFILVDSWEAGFQNWTDRFAAEFEKRRGYSLLPWLPALAGETLGSARESEAVLFDFRRTIADLIRESYYERLAALLHERGVELHAEVIYGGGGYPPLDVLRATKPVDLPMFEFWTSTDDDRLLKYETGGAGEGDVGSLAYNLPAAAAAGYGKPLLGSEAYTGYAHYSESPAELKPFGDRAFAAGINRMILHSSVHQPTDEKPGMTLGPFASHFNRNNLYWNHASSWLAYQARIQSVLGQGTPVFDVLYFLGDQLPQSFVRNASTTLPAGYTVDAVNAELLAERVAVVDGRLRLNGADAALLSLHPQPYLSLDSLKRIEALVAAGAHVYGPRPLHTLSLEDSRQAAAFRALAERVWGDVDGVRVFSRAYGKGSVSWGPPIAQLLAQRHVPPQLAAGPGHERDFLFAHRRVGDADVFFVANQWDRALSRELSFRVGPRTPEVWDPETGEVSRPAAFRSEGDQLTLPVQFAPYQALLFVFRPGLPARFVTSVARGGTTLFPATGAPAEVPRLVFEKDGLAVVPETPGPLALRTSDGRTLSGRFVAPQELAVAGLRGTLELRGPAAPAKPIEITALRSLTEYEQPEIRYFSGEATYRLRFSVPDWKAAAGDLLRLDLGDFESVAEVALNGQPLGTLWKPGSALDVTRSLRRDNELVVTVANVYRNRAIGDLTQYGELKNLHTSSPISDFLSPKKPLKPSGLLGPLRVTRIPRQRVPGL